MRSRISFAAIFFLLPLALFQNRDKFFVAAARYEPVGNSQRVRFISNNDAEIGCRARFKIRGSGQGRHHAKLNHTRDHDGSRVNGEDLSRKMLVRTERVKSHIYRLP